MNKFLFFLLLSSLVLGSSCKTLTSPEGVKLKPRSAKFLQKRMVQQQVDADWFSAKMKVTYRDGNEVTRFTGYIRMQKDSLIWINVKKLSVEAGRALITPDSIFVIDRLNSGFLKKDFNYIQNTFHFPATFAGMQQVFLGNPIFLTTELEEEIEPPFYKLSGKTTAFANTYWLEAVNYHLRQMLVEDLDKDRRLLIELSDYQSLDKDKKFAYFRNFAMESKETGVVSIDVEFSKVEINVPKSIRFEIPDRYTEIQ